GGARGRGQIGRFLVPEPAPERRRSLGGNCQELTRSVTDPRTGHTRRVLQRTATPPNTGEGTPKFTCRGRGRAGGAFGSAWQRPSAEPPNRYLPFFSRFPSMSNSCFLPPKADAALPLNLSPSIVSVKSRGNPLPLNFRTAENVRVLAFSFTSLSFSSFWSGQLIVPASLSPSILIVKVAVSFWLPIS